LIAEGPRVAVARNLKLEHLLLRLEARFG